MLGNSGAKSMCKETLCLLRPVGWANTIGWANTTAKLLLCTSFYDSRIALGAKGRKIPGIVRDRQFVQIHELLSINPNGFHARWASYHGWLGTLVGQTAKNNIR